LNRAQLQWLARERIREAKALLLSRRWSGAYYLAGYSVECALKSCVIAYLMRTDDFPDRRFSEQCWTHDLTQLIRLAGLKPQFDTDLAADRTLDANWTVVKDWNEKSRYERITRSRSRRLYTAITDKKHGVLSWIRSRW
jgi:HEPN domain-containing protein